MKTSQKAYVRIQQLMQFKRWICNIDNEIFDVVKVDDELIKLLARKHLTNDDLTEAYPCFKFAVRFCHDCTVLAIDSTYGQHIKVSLGDWLLIGFTIPQIKVAKTFEALNAEHTQLANESSTPFISINDTSKSCQQFSQLCQQFNAGDSNVSKQIMCMMNNGKKLNVTMSTLCKLEDFKVGIQFWLDDSSMMSFDESWKLCQVTYIRQDVIFYKVLDEEQTSCKPNEHHMLADSVLLQLGRAEPTEVDMLDVDIRYYRPVSNSGKVHVKLSTTNGVITTTAYKSIDCK